MIAYVNYTLKSFIFQKTGVSFHIELQCDHCPTVFLSLNDLSSMCLSFIICLSIYHLSIFYLIIYHPSVIFLSSICHLSILSILSIYELKSTPVVLCSPLYNSLHYFIYRHSSKIKLGVLQRVSLTSVFFFQLEKCLNSSWQFAFL